MDNLLEIHTRRGDVYRSRALALRKLATMARQSWRAIVADRDRWKNAAEIEYGRALQWQDGYTEAKAWHGKREEELLTQLAAAQKQRDRAEELLRAQAGELIKALNERDAAIVSGHSNAERLAAIERAANGVAA